MLGILLLASALAILAPARAHADIPCTIENYDKSANCTGLEACGGLCSASLIGPCVDCRRRICQGYYMQLHLSCTNEINQAIKTARDPSRSEDDRAKARSKLSALREIATRPELNFSVGVDEHQEVYFTVSPVKEREGQDSRLIHSDKMWKDIQQALGPEDPPKGPEKAKEPKTKDSSKNLDRLDSSNDNPKSDEAAKQEERRETAREALKAGNSDKARESLDQLIASNPSDAQAYSLRSLANLKQNRIPEARSDAEIALRLDSSNKLAGDVLAFAGSAERSKGLGGFKVNGPEFGALGGGEEGGGGAGRGLADRRSGAAGGPEGAGAGFDFTKTAGPAAPLLQSAAMKMKLGDLSGALLEATRAIAADKANPSAWALRAAVSNRLKNYAAAKKDAEEALKLDPKNIQALIELGYAEYNLGNYADALARLNEAIAVDPANALAYLYRAMVLEKLGRMDEALADYEKAAELDSSLSPLLEEARTRIKGKGSAPAAPTGGQSRKMWWWAAAAAALILMGIKKNLWPTQPPAEEAAGEQASAEESSGTAAPGTMLGGSYRIEREIARGGMGVVYEALDVKLQRKVAIKHLQDEAYRNPEVRSRFLREAQLVAKLRHPNIAEIFSVIGDDELFLVFELVEGQSLAGLLSARARLKPEEAHPLLKDVCSALDYAHSKKVIHRDLKPSNVMLGSDGRARIMDFGIAHEAKTMSNPTQTAGWGTPPYMAPEQGMGSVSKASDLYALGVMTYELLAGRMPFAGPDFLDAKLRKEFAPLSKADPALAPYDAFIATALDPDPTKRHDSGAAFLSGFEAAAPLR